MKEYPSIDTRLIDCSRAYIFDKLDGSCIRAEWTKKKEFWKFGSRTRLLGTDQEYIWKSEGMILEKYSESLGRIFADKKYPKVTCYFEFFGPNSFAGTHQDEEHNIVLFDIAVERQGIMPAREFVKLVKYDIEIPPVLWQGPVNMELVERVRNSEMPGMTFEGVVCKGHPKGGKPQMTKIKSRAWLDKLREYCGNNQRLFKRLA
jgi:hypothetical protein